MRTDVKQDAKSKLPMVMPLRDYERAFRVMHAVLNGVDAKPEKACQFFACVGSYLLNAVYRIPATAVAGAALYQIGPGSGDVAVIGGMRDGQPFSDIDHFHMWVETETHVIDFQAPVFREALGVQAEVWKVPRQMFQRGLSEQCDGDFNSPGDFDVFPDPELTEDRVNAFLERDASRDLLRCCAEWFTRPPKPIMPVLGLASNDGSVRHLALSPIRIDGAWGR